MRGSVTAACRRPVSAKYECISFPRGYLEGFIQNSPSGVVKRGEQLAFQEGPV